MRYEKAFNNNFSHSFEKTPIKNREFVILRNLLRFLKFLIFSFVF